MSISCQRGLKVFDLNTWLSDFQDCNINVMVLESDILIEKFDYPVSLSTNFVDDSKLLNGNHKSFPVWPVIETFPRHILCAVQVFALTQPQTLLNQTLFGPKAEQLVFPSLDCSIILSESRYSWTNCVAIVVGLSHKAWTDWSAKFPNWLNAKVSEGSWPTERTEGIQQIQYFILFSVDEEDEDKIMLNNNTEMGKKIRLNGCLYLCRLCWSWNDSHVPFQVTFVKPYFLICIAYKLMSPLY